MSSSSTAEPAAGSIGSVFGRPYRLTTIGLIIVVTLVAFEAMSVAAALPTAAKELHGLALYGWSFTGFLVTDMVGLVASAILCDRRGPRPSLVLGLALFFTGLLLAGTAGSMHQLIAGRCLQGLGGGFLLTALYVVLGECYPDPLRPKIIAAISSAWVLPSLIGPPLSGLLTEHLTWRLVFLGLAPLVCVGGLLMVPTLRGLSTAPRDTAGRDRYLLIRAVAAAAGVALLVQAGQHPQLAWLASAPFGLVLLLWGLARLLPDGTFRARSGVPATIALRGLFAGAFFGCESLIPLSLTVQHGYSASAAGLPLLGSALGWAIGSWWQGREAMTGRRPALIQLGFVLLASACAAAALVSLPGVPGWLMYSAWPVAGMGAGLTMSSVGVLLLQRTTDADRGRDSAALQLSDAVVSSLTTGLGGVLVAAAARGHIGYTTAFVAIDLAMVALAAAGAVAAVRTR